MLTHDDHEKLTESHANSLLALWREARDIFHAKGARAKRFAILAMEARRLGVMSAGMPKHLTLNEKIRDLRDLIGIALTNAFVCRAYLAAKRPSSTLRRDTQVAMAFDWMKTVLFPNYAEATYREALRLMRKRGLTNVEALYAARRYVHDKATRAACACSREGRYAGWIGDALAGHQNGTHWTRYTRDGWTGRDLVRARLSPMKGRPGDSHVIFEIGDLRTLEYRVAEALARAS